MGKKVKIVSTIISVFHFLQFYRLLLEVEDWPCLQVVFLIT